MKTVNVITSLNIEERPYCGDFYEFFKMVSLERDLLAMTPDGGGILMEKKVEKQVVPVSRFLGGEYGDGTYIVHSPDVDSFLGGPFECLRKRDDYLTKQLSRHLETIDEQYKEIKRIKSLGLFSRIFKKWD